MKSNLKNAMSRYEKLMLLKDKLRTENLNLKRSLNSSPQKSMGEDDVQDDNNQSFETNPSTINNTKKIKKKKIKIIDGSHITNNKVKIKRLCDNYLTPQPVPVHISLSPNKNITRIKKRNINNNNNNNNNVKRSIESNFDRSKSLRKVISQSTDILLTQRKHIQVIDTLTKINNSMENEIQKMQSELNENRKLLKKYKEEKDFHFDQLINDENKEVIMLKVKIENLERKSFQAISRMQREIEGRLAAEKVSKSFKERIEENAKEIEEKWKNTLQESDKHHQNKFHDLEAKYNKIYQENEVYKLSINQLDMKLREANADLQENKYHLNRGKEEVIRLNESNHHLTRELEREREHCELAIIKAKNDSSSNMYIAELQKMEETHSLLQAHVQNIEERYMIEHNENESLRSRVTELQNIFDKINNTRSASNNKNNSSQSSHHHVKENNNNKEKSWLKGTVSTDRKGITHNSNSNNNNKSNHVEYEENYNRVEEYKEEDEESVHPWREEDEGERGSKREGDYNDRDIMEMLKEERMNRNNKLNHGNVNISPPRLTTTIKNNYNNPFSILEENMSPNSKWSTLLQRSTSMPLNKINFDIAH